MNYKNHRALLAVGKNPVNLIAAYPGTLYVGISYSPRSELLAVAVLTLHINIVAGLKVLSAAFCRRNQLDSIEDFVIIRR